MLQEYTDEGNQKQQPIMVHRAIFGSIERFFGILIENCAGAFPLWLAPVQCRIMPVTDAVQDYAQQVAAQMREAGIRVQLDSGEMGVGCSLSLVCAVLQTHVCFHLCWRVHPFYISNAQVWYCTLALKQSMWGTFAGATCTLPNMPASECGMF